MRYSDNIEIFLEFLRQAKREYQISITEEREKDAASQGLDHRLELGDNSYHDMAIFAKVRLQVRRERRQAKDRQQELKPITDWMYQNPRVIKSLEELLGTVRRAEKALEGRMYTPKTNILKEVFKENKHEG